VGSDQSAQLVRRLKVLAGMDIADTMRPQDGRMSVQHEGRNIDMRISTLHASDALSTLDRLYGMDIDTGALSGALKGIIGQRLVRTLCNDCAAPVRLDELPAHQQGLLSGRKTDSIRKPVGCAKCRNTGYRGRTIVAEIFLVTPAIQRAISRRANLGELSELARECGAITMWESGLERVLSGATSLFELLDNVAAPIVEGPAENQQADVDALLAQLLAKPVSHPAPPREPLPDLPDVTNSAFIRSIDAGDGATSVDASVPRAPRAIARPHGPGALRVLVVHESHAERRRLADALIADGFAVLEAADGAQALAYTRRLRPEVILTEVALPGLDAVGLLQALSVEQLTTRVLINTRQTDQELHAWLIELGAEDVTLSTEPMSGVVARLRTKAAA
jgi:CheY-like chemotaxis protein